MAEMDMDFTEYTGVIGVDGYGAIITVKNTSQYLFDALVG